MKLINYFFLSLITGMILLSGCKKDDPKPQTRYEDPGRSGTFTGTWDGEMAVSGIKISSPLSMATYNHTTSYSSDSYYQQIYIEDDPGTYHLLHMEFFNIFEKGAFINFDSYFDLDLVFDHDKGAISNDLFGFDFTVYKKVSSTDVLEISGNYYPYYDSEYTSKLTVKNSAMNFETGRFTATFDLEIIPEHNNSGNVLKIKNGKIDVTLPKKLQEPIFLSEEFKKIN